MRMRMRTAAAVLAAMVAAGCGRFGGGGGSGGDDAPDQRGTEAAQQDSARASAQALRDSGVTVDTQTVDTGTAATTHVDDN